MWQSWLVYLRKNNQAALPEELEYYYGPNDYNRTFYYHNDSEMDQQLKNILEDEDKLLSVSSSDYDDVTEYQLLARCPSEQTVVEEAVRRLHTKEDDGFHSDMLQNPSDLDATFRKKASRACYQSGRDGRQKQVSLRINSTSRSTTATPSF